jgi:enoyl-CoA hydratase/carnithine racemase
MSWGLINDIAPAADLMRAAEALAAQVANADPAVLDYAKRALREIPDLSWSASIEYGLRTGALVRQQVEINKQNQEGTTP